MRISTSKKQFILDVYSYLKAVFIGFDQAFGAIAGFGPHWTISAVTGKNANRSWYWKLTEFIINFTFYPVDGVDHCNNAWQTEYEEDYKHGAWFLLFTIAFVFCVPLAVVFWTIHGIKQIFNGNN
jgi:hypothetical protein